MGLGRLLERSVVGLCHGKMSLALKVYLGMAGVGEIGAKVSDHKNRSRAHALHKDTSEND